MFFTRYFLCRGKCCDAHWHRSLVMCVGLKSREDFDLGFALEANYFLSSGCLCSVFHCSPPGSSLLPGFMGYWLCARMYPDPGHPYFCWTVLHAHISETPKAREISRCHPCTSSSGLLVSASPGCAGSGLPSMQGATIGTLCSINSCASL